MARVIGIGQSLVGLIGAGLGSIATGFVPMVAPNAIASGDALTRFVARHSDNGFGLVLEEVATEVWEAAKAAGLSSAVIGQHLAALPELLDRERIDGETFAVALAGAQAIRRFGGKPDVIAARLVDETIAHLTAIGSLHAAGLDERATRIILQSLYGGLLARPRELLAARRAITVFSEHIAASASAADPRAVCASPAITAPPSDRRDSSGLVVAARRICDVTGLSENALAAIVAAGHAQGLHDLEILHQLEENVVDALELMGGIGDAASQVGDNDALEQHLGEVLAAMRNGELGEAKRRLSACAHQLMADGAPIDPISRERARQAARLMQLAARIDELRGAWLAAAAELDIAARTLGDHDRVERWELLVRRATALGRHGIAEGDTNALHEAVNVYTLAARMISERDRPVEWAIAHIDLGRILLQLGELEERPERFLAAVLHFKPAAQVFSAQHDSEHWAQAQLGIADGLRCQGCYEASPSVLSEAVFAYRAVLGALSKERSPRDWLQAQVRFGETLVRLGEVTGGRQHFEAAVVPLTVAAKRLAEEPRTALLSVAEASLGTAFAALAVDPLDVDRLAQAASLLQGVLKGGTRHLKRRTIANLAMTLGDVLWTLGLERHEDDCLLAAAEAKFTALAQFESLKIEQAAAAARADLVLLDRQVREWIATGSDLTRAAG